MSVSPPRSPDASRMPQPRAIVPGNPLNEAKERLETARECQFDATRRGLDSRVPGIAKVFPIAALAPTKRRETLDRLDPHDVFRHFVAELTFDTQPQRRAMRNVQRLVIHIVGQD